MRLINLFKRLLRGGGQGQTRKTQPPPALPKMLKSLAATQEVEYSCDDVLQVLDQFAEAFLRGENVAGLMPLVQRHLEMCPDCREEFEALLRILKASPA